MGLKNQIGDDMKTAMRARDQAKVQTLRMILAKIQDAELTARVGKGGEAALPEEAVLDVVTKYAKQVRESLEGAQQAGRPEMAENATAELQIVEAYLPQQLGREEVTAIVQEAVTASGAKSKKDMGNVMKLVMPKVKGRADGKMINEIVRALLD